MNPSVNFKTLYDVYRHISAVVHSSTNLEEVLELVVWKASEVFGSKGAVLRTFNVETQEFDLFASHGLSEKYLTKAPVSSKKLVTDLCHLNKPLIIRDNLADPRVRNREELKEDGIRMVMDIPLCLRENIIGIIRIYFDHEKEFSDEMLDFAAAIGELFSCAIDKAKMIEEQRSRYDQLALQTEKLSSLGRMAAGIAHEINNPLTGILLFSSRMRKKVTEGGHIQEGLDVIIRETQRCKSIIQDLLEFSRDKDPEKVKANINDVIEKALSILENEFRLHHISVEKNFSSGMPSVLLDVNLMQQVFVNLLINAVEAIQDKGVVTVRSYLKPDRRSVGVEVADTGPGISSDNMGKVFDPFFSTKNNGTGLGLAVSYGIIQKHQGNIQVSSKLEEGTRFTIEIPILQ
ncbi:MAG: ATP-binding protein [Desulfobacteraceae bacterium]|jgi:signal transduction histidine kinase